VIPGGFFLPRVVRIACGSPVRLRGGPVWSSTAWLGSVSLTSTVLLTPHRGGLGLVVLIAVVVAAIILRKRGT